jgi:hypothetical protein
LFVPTPGTLPQAATAPMPLCTPFGCRRAQALRAVESQLPGRTLLPGSGRRSCGACCPVPPQNTSAPSLPRSESNREGKKETHPFRLISAYHRHPRMLLLHQRQHIRRCQVALTLQCCEFSERRATAGVELAESTTLLVHDGSGCSQRALSAPSTVRESGKERTTSVVSFRYVVSVKHLVVIRLSERIRVPCSERQVAFEVRFEAGERVLSEEGGGAVLADDGDEVGEAGHLAVNGARESVTGGKGGKGRARKERTSHGKAPP